MKRILALSALSFLACAQQSAVGNSVGRAGLSVAEANRIVAAFEDSKDAAPTVEPKSLEDVLAILKSDNLTNFPAAAKFLEAQKGNEALALQAQLQLAWGEAQMILSELLARADQNLEKQRQRMEAKESSGSGLSADEIKELE